jgi:hypothetical protein
MAAIIAMMPVLFAIDGADPDGPWSRRQYPSSRHPDPTTVHPVPVSVDPHITWAWYNAYRPSDRNWRRRRRPDDNTHAHAR